MKRIYKIYIKPFTGLITAIIAGIILGIIINTKNLTLEQIGIIFLISIMIPLILLMLVLIILTYKYEINKNKEKYNKENKEKKLLKKNQFNYYFKIKEEEKIINIKIEDNEFTNAYIKLKQNHPNSQLLNFEIKEKAGN